MVNAGATAARGGVVTLMGQGFRVLIQLISFVTLARLLTPGDFGIIAMAMGVVGFGVLIGDAGLSFAILRAEAINKKQSAALFWVSGLIGVALAAATTSGAGLLADFYGVAEVRGVSAAMSVIFVLYGMTAQLRASLMRSFRFRAVVVCDNAGQLMGFLGGLLFAVFQKDYWALVVQQILAALVVFVLFFCVVRPPLIMHRRLQGVGGLVRFGLQAFAVQLSDFLSTSIPAILLGRYSGSVQLGYYDRAYALFAMPMTQLAGPLTKVVLPILARVTSFQEKAGLLARAQIIFSYVLVGMLSLLAALSDPIVPLVLGAKWEEAVPIIQILALGGVFQALAYVFGWAFLTAGRAATQVLLVAPIRLAMVVSAIFLVRFGAVGVAWAIAIGLVLIWVVCGIFGMRRIGFGGFGLMRSSFPGLLFFTGMFVTVRLARFTIPDSVPLAWRGALLLVVALSYFVTGVIALPIVRNHLRFVLRFAWTAVSQGRQVGSLRP